MSVATETERGAAGRQHPWERRPRAKAKALLLPLVATLGAGGIVQLQVRLIGDGHPLPVSGILVALVVALAATWIALRAGVVTKEEMGLGSPPHLWPFVLFFFGGFALLSLGLMAFRFAGPALWGRTLQEHLVELNAYYGWCVYLTGSVPIPQPWAQPLMVVVEELLFRALWLPILWRVTQRYLWANLGQALAFALWHGPFYLHFSTR